MSIFDIWSRLRRRDERRLPEVKASRARTASTSDGGYNPVTQGHSAISGGGSVHAPSCGSASSSHSDNGTFCAGGDGGGGD